MPTRPTASCTDRSNSPLGELDEPCPTSQQRVGSTNPTRSSNSSLGELDEHHSTRPTARWSTNPPRPTVSWINQSNSPLGELDEPFQTRPTASCSVFSSFAFAELDQTRTMQSRLRNSPLWVSVELSLVSSRSELPLKLYRKNEKNLFSCISSDQSYKDDND